MVNLSSITKMLPLIIPIVLLLLGLQIFALVDVARREKTKGPKWIWVLVIVFGEILGSVIYFIFGRDE